jgi:type I restriction enzyme S subunit
MEPKLRFKAFSDELSHHTLMDIIVEKPSNGIMNRQSDKVTAVKHINVIDMYTDDKIHVDELRYSEYGDTAVEKCNVEIGDIFLTRSSVKADGIAKSNILLDDGIYVYDDHLIRLKVDKNNYIPEFVNDYLASPRFRRQFIVRAKTTAFTTIGQGDVASCTGDFPSLPEQQKIAEFLSTIDTVIKKQKETVSAWEERKKGVMQKLFSQEVRFKADDGSDFPEWEEKYLSDIASFHSGLTYTPDDVVDSENGILVFRSSNIQNGRIAYDDNVYVDKELKEKNYVKLHDIVVCVRNGSKSLVGKNALVTESDLNATWGAFMSVIRAKQNYEFIHQYLNSTFFKKEMYKDSGTATINQITTAMLNGCKLFVPSLAEQQKIADCLSSLDEVIEKQKATLAVWEELKKGLLQQMFV